MRKRIVLQGVIWAAVAAFITFPLVQFAFDVYLRMRYRIPGVNVWNSFAMDAQLYFPRVAIVVVAVVAAETLLLLAVPRFSTFLFVIFSVPLFVVAAVWILWVTTSIVPYEQRGYVSAIAATTLLLTRVAVPYLRPKRAGAPSQDGAPGRSDS